MATLFRNKFDHLEDLFTSQIEDLYDAEKRLVSALPKMAETAHSPELQQAFRHHLDETKHQVSRLEEAFKIIGKSPERETCEAMKGLIKEGEEMIQAKGADTVRDAALIAAAQRVEHYEMAGYGTARSLANQLGFDRAAQLLEQTLEEEKQADKKLTQIATSAVNTAASRA